MRWKTWQILQHSKHVCTLFSNWQCLINKPVIRVRSRHSPTHRNRPARDGMLSNRRLYEPKRGDASFELYAYAPTSTSVSVSRSNRAPSRNTFSLKHIFRVTSFEQGTLRPPIWYGVPLGVQLILKIKPKKWRKPMTHRHNLFLVPGFPLLHSGTMLAKSKKNEVANSFTVFFFLDIQQ